MLSQPSKNALALNQIRKTYAGKQVLSQLNLAVPYGSVFAFLGNNGEGKSTTIRVLTGLEAPDSGSVTICGDSLYAERRSLLSRSARFVPNYRLLHRLGGLIDAPSLYHNLTAAEFLSIGCSIKGLPVGEIDRVLAVVSLTDAAKRLIGQFSLGMKQRLAIAHTLLGDPKLLILDEPTNGLDPSGIRDIRQLLSELPASTGTTVFFSTHNLDEVEKMATRFAVLKDGRIRFESDIPSWQAAQKFNMTLEVGDANAAHTVLCKHGFHSTMTNSNTVLVDRLPRDEQPRLHALLVNEGIELFQSYQIKTSLEQWFTNEHTD
ncbi:ATP-binding cassette domain-containing protein [Alteromonas sp. ZYF713]|nr:ATP-binding cassette domain-containing protein [Alteromonas sp. ZYF713]